MDIGVPPPRVVSETTVVPAVRARLTPDSMRKISNFIDANLDSTIHIKHLAALCNHSRYYFARVFRQSFGEPPHAYIVRKRIERAKSMMLTGVTPLSQIAVECGLVDQSHLTKLFRRWVGEPPGAWRRTRTTLL